jgi:uncharacterized membrane protein
MHASPWTVWCMVLGFALGGVFDGILLHQILQWHHLLSAIEGHSHLQVRWDGYFHGAMYILAVASLWALWRAHRTAPDANGRPLTGALLIGFGAWHVVDAVLAHWVLGLHHIRMDSGNPLLWDLIWLAAFGLVPLVLGWVLAPRGGRARG